MSNKTAKWSQNLSSNSWVNSVAISGDGSRVVGGTFCHDYSSARTVQGTFGTFGYDSAGNRLWADTFEGSDGIFAVGISGNGRVAAGGGLATQTEGLLKIFNGQTGSVLFDSKAAGSGGIDERVNGVSLSTSGNLVAAAAGQLYVLVKSKQSYVPALSATPAGDPDFQTALGRVSAVAVHPTGRWLGACNQRGQVLVATIEKRKVTRTFLWGAPEEPVNPASPGSPVAPVPFLCIAIAARTDSFVVGGGNVAYHGSLSDISIGNKPSRYEAGDAGAPAGSVFHGTPRPQPNVRWMAISANGATFAAVANRRGGQHGKGQLLVFKKGTLVPTAMATLPENSNGVSMDRTGKILAVANGYPVGSAANIYRFDLHGSELWRFPTSNMNWPVAVSANGSGIVAGGDDGYLSYFLP